MQQKRMLIIAAVVVAVMVALVIVFGSRQLPQTGTPEERAVWLPQLKPKLDALSKLHLQSASDAVTLVKSDKGWGVQQRSGYPVAFSRLEELLNALANARIVERKTARAEFLERLGLNDIEKPDSKAVLVEGWADKAEPLFRVLIGNEADGRTARYVREAATNQAWLIDTSPEPLASVSDWLDPRMLGLEFERVGSVVRTLPGKEEFTATRTKDRMSNLNVASIPQGKKLKFPSVFDNAARAILTATVEDVKPLSELDFAADKCAMTAITLFDGLRIDIAALKREDGNWVRLSVAVSETAATQPVAEAADETANSTDAGATAQPDTKSESKKPAKEPEEIALKPKTDPDAEAALLSARLDGWAFKVSDYVYDELSKALDGYLDDDKPEPAADAAHGDQQ